MTDLVERGEALATLQAALQDVAAGGKGHIVLVAGEAGIGKTSVLRTFAAANPATPLWWGGCDALQTPHPLAPLHDIARDAPGGVRFAALLDDRQAGARAAVFDAVLDELRRAGEPTLVVIDDVHWADDATLDLIKFLGRRIARTRALLAVTWRDDEVGPAHPLRRALGELPSEALTRIALLPLSAEAVAAMAQRAGRHARGLHAATQGNPFFVSEVLRQHPQGELPPSVQALVLARYARLAAGAQQVVRLASLVPARIERWLVDAVLAPALADVEATLDSGLLLADAATLAFRHELARVAIEASLPAATAQALHAQALHALTSAPHRAPSPARLVHHAAHARDAEAVRRHAPVAAEEATRRGAHRAAAAQWRLAIEHDTTPPSPEHAQWLEAYATECQLTDQLDAAIDARARLGALYRARGQTLREADNDSRTALVHVLALRNAEADAASLRAIAQLEALPPSIELAAAYRVQAQLRMLNRDCAQSTAWSRKAIALAEAYGNRELLAAAYGSLGAALEFSDWTAGAAELQRALDIALADGLHWIAANTYVNLGSGAGELFRLDEADTWLRAAIAFAAQHEIDFYLNYARGWLALVKMYRGDWDDATALATLAAERAGATTTSRVMALIALGRLRARRGDPGADEALDAALALAERSGTLQRVGPARAARAEAAFLRGDAARAIDEARAALPLAVAHAHAWFSGELAFWLWRCDALDGDAPSACAAPYALQLAGRWREAAQAWQALRCPYESARALADGDAAAQREALAAFEQLGARPAADALRARLRATGERDLAPRTRGPRAATREHPFGLTQRELQTLQLLCEGLRNAEIAERLHRSVRTVDHHLAAVFAKLGVDSRAAAIAAARRAQIGQAPGAK